MLAGDAGYKSEGRLGNQFWYVVFFIRYYHTKYAVIIINQEKVKTFI